MDQRPLLSGSTMLGNEEDIDGLRAGVGGERCH
jgi:hypothetical protein